MATSLVSLRTYITVFPNRIYFSFAPHIYGVTTYCCNSAPVAQFTGADFDKGFPSFHSTFAKTKEGAKGKQKQTQSFLECREAQKNVGKTKHRRLHYASCVVPAGVEL